MKYTESTTVDKSTFITLAWKANNDLKIQNSSNWIALRSKVNYYPQLNALFN